MVQLVKESEYFLDLTENEQTYADDAWMRHKKKNIKHIYDITLVRWSDIFLRSRMKVHSQ